MAKILLADDDADMREICLRFLTSRGHELIVTKDADEAVRMARVSVPELILMDMRMPDQQGGTVNDQAGLEAARRIRAIPELASIPIVALTGHNMVNFKETILAAGCCEILPKPLENLMDLLTLIKRHTQPGSPV